MFNKEDKMAKKKPAKKKTANKKTAKKKPAKKKKNGGWGHKRRSKAKSRRR